MGHKREWLCRMFPLGHAMIRYWLVLPDAWIWQVGDQSDISAENLKEFEMTRRKHEQYSDLKGYSCQTWTK